MQHLGEKTNNCTFYITRHGETIWNVEHRVQGHTDNPLTEKGERQASGLAKELQTIHFDAVYSSDFLRAKRTAEIIALEKKLAVQTTQALRERNMGVFEGTIIDTMSSYNELAQWFNQTNNPKRLEMEVESDEEIIGRLITFLREVSVVNPGKNVVVVTHAGLMKALLVHLGVATHQQFQHGAIKNTAYIVLQSDGVDFFVKKLKDILIS